MLSSHHKVVMKEEKYRDKKMYKGTKNGCINKIVDTPLYYIVKRHTPSFSNNIKSLIIIHSVLHIDSNLLIIPP